MLFLIKIFNMNKKKLIQIIFGLVLIIGFALSLFKGTRPFGLLLLSVIQPIIALYYISLFKKDESETNLELQLRIPLLISLQITFVLLPIKYLFMAMYWPFGAIINVLLFALTIISLILGIGFIVFNRKTIRSVFIFEFVVMTIPVLLFLGIHSRIDYSRKEYSEMLNKEYNDLCKIENTLYKQAQKDTTINLTQVDILQEMKQNSILNSGGVNENVQVIGALQKVDEGENRFVIRNLKNDSLVAFINKEPTIVIDYLNRLTKIQIDLLLKEKK
jgi:hypothetical protein